MEVSDEAALICSCAGLDRMKSRTFHASLCSTGPYGGQHFKDQLNGSDLGPLFDGGLGPYSTATSSMTLVTAQNSLPHFRRLHVRTLETTVLTAFPFQIRINSKQPRGKERQRRRNCQFSSGLVSTSRPSMAISPIDLMVVNFPHLRKLAATDDAP